MDLPDALKLLSTYSGKNFVLMNGASGKVTLNVKNTPWDQVLAVVLASNKLGYQKINDVYRIAPSADIRQEIDEAAKAALASQTLIPLETRLIPLNYAKASEIQPNLLDFKSERGKVSIEARTNSLVVTDTPDVLEKVVTYVQAVDKQTAVVQIDVRIVEASQDFSRSLNQNFGIGPVQAGQKLAGSFVGIGNAGQNIGSTTPDIGNFPKDGLRLNTGLGNIGTIDAFLRMNDTKSMAKLVSSPRINVLDNKKANIKSGRTITAASVVEGAPGLSVTQNLELDVQPSVTSDGFVQLTVTVKNNNDGSAEGSTTVITNTREATTELLVESGKTAVIGGVYASESSKTESGFPILSSIPLFGVLFRTENTSKNQSRELVMFLQPKILNMSRAFMSYKDDLKSLSTRKATNSKADEPADEESLDNLL
jgi:type IV pilus assembly protein PilQ